MAEPIVKASRRAGSGLLMLIKDILALPKGQAGHLELERVEFGLHPACEAIATQADLELKPAISAARNEKAPVQPARILVVDDWPDNRLLVKMYLKDSPYQLTFEENGKAAVDRFTTSDFDLILMDVQMPVMDGLDATRAIRALERQRGAPPIPILALTAHASLQDTEKSVDAGCNAHLSKPISKLQLLSAIEKHRRHLKPAGMAQYGSREPIGIEMSPGLEDIVPGYLSNRRKEVSEMFELLAASDFARLAFLGHNLKGTAAGYGFPDLTRLGAALERSADQMDGGTLRSLMNELGDYLDRVQLIAKM